MQSEPLFFFKEAYAIEATAAQSRCGRSTSARLLRTGDGCDGSHGSCEENRSWRTPLLSAYRRTWSGHQPRGVRHIYRSMSVALSHLVLLELRPPTHSAASHVHHLTERVSQCGGKTKTRDVGAQFECIWLRGCCCCCCFFVLRMDG